ncbi:MAG: patatin-like phospholipase family protein, partial [Rhodothalassiaceae bacterium]
MTTAARRKKGHTPAADPRIGIALGSGSARGWAHIGVLEALAEAGIRPGIVTGASIGAFVGAAYANHQLADLADWVRRLTWRGILSVMDLSLLEGGLLKGEELMQVAHAHMGSTDIAELPLAFGAVATELRTGREVWLREGPVLEAVRASIALPGLFTPVARDG